MTGHWIRLRGGWEWSDAAVQGAPAHRVTLPIDRRAGLAGAVRFLRWFHTPPVNPVSEEVLLHLSDVHGLRGVWLNDRQIARPETPTEPLILTLNDLHAARNKLVLEAQLAPIGGAGMPESWGAVALVIRERAAAPPAD